MVINLTTIFGSNIIVADQPRDGERQFVGFAGVHGLVSMWMGSHGKQIVVRGRLYGGGANYAAKRADVRALVANLEALQWADAADYSFMNDTYYSVVWAKPELIPDSNGKIYHWTADGYVCVDFVQIGRQLI